MLFKNSMAEEVVIVSFYLNPKNPRKENESTKYKRSSLFPTAYSRVFKILECPQCIEKCISRKHTFLSPLILLAGSSIKNQDNVSQPQPSVILISQLN